jgi:ABC-2 type transport system permease protein
MSMAVEHRTSARPNLAAAVAAERIKLTSTRSPWWCAGLGVVTTAGLGAIVSVATQIEGGPPLTVATTQLVYSVGMAVVMVLAALAVTVEYSVGTIRTTYLAVPRRGVALGAKTVVVAAVAAAVGLLGAFGSWGLSAVLVPGVDLALDGAVEWRQVAGVGAVYLLAAVIALSVGILVRHTAGAVALVLVWALMAEQLIGLLPGIGAVLTPWLPFQAGKFFLTSDGTGTGLLGSPWTALGYLTAVAAALLAVAIAVAKRRDA